MQFVIDGVCVVIFKEVFDDLLKKFKCIILGNFLSRMLIRLTRSMQMCRAERGVSIVCASGALDNIKGDRVEDFVG